MTSFQRWKLGNFVSKTNPVVTTFTLLTWAGCEMQFQQVRFIGHSGEIRRPLYSFSQHLQWEGSCIIAIICHPLQKWMATNYHYDNGCLNSWCWCQRSIIWLSHIKDHQLLLSQIYILLWFWFVFLTVVSGLNLVWRVSVLSKQWSFRKCLSLPSLANIKQRIDPCFIHRWILLNYIEDGF